MNGDYRVLHRAVYLVVPFPLRHSETIAAVLACGPGAALSHSSAAHLYGLLPHPAQPRPVHVTAPSDHRLDGVTVHRATLAHYEVRERHGIPVTAPIRTILDLAGLCGNGEVDAAVAEAFALRLTNANALRRAIKPGRRGAQRLRALLDAGPQRTRSSPERRLLAGLRSAGIDGFQTNVRIGPWEVDFYWPSHGLVVEVDGYAAHSSPAAFERDRRKDAELAEAGVAVRRFSANQVRDDLGRVVARIRRALSSP